MSGHPQSPAWVQQPGRLAEHLRAALVALGADYPVHARWVGVRLAPLREADALHIEITVDGGHAPHRWPVDPGTVEWPDAEVVTWARFVAAHIVTRRHPVGL